MSLELYAVSNVTSVLGDTSDALIITPLLARYETILPLSIGDACTETPGSVVADAHFLRWSQCFGFAQSIQAMRRPNDDLPEPVSGLAMFLCDWETGPLLIGSVGCKSMYDWLHDRASGADEAFGAEFLRPYHCLLQAFEIGAENGYLLLC